MQISQNKLYIIGGGLLIAVIAVVLFLFLSFGFGAKPPTRVTLQFWGVFDSSDLYRQAINDYQEKFPNVRIVYKKLNPADYEKELLNSFSSGTGPDIWLMSNTWLGKHGDKIQPLPQDIQKDTKQPLFTYKQFTEQFVDVAAQDLTQKGLIYGLPLYVDTLALFFNKDIFNTKNVSTPPSTWNEFNNDTLKITTNDQSGNITLSAAAIGTAQNINRSTDILGLLMLQAGAQMTDADNASATFSRPVSGINVGESALQYYTNFANPANQLYTWNEGKHYSIDAFAEGSTAMMFNYSHQIATLRERAPRLNFSVASMPQFPNATKVNYASYWAPTVAKASPNGLEAWKFLTYLATTPATSTYLNAAERPAARRDLIEQQKNDPTLGVFATQALSARSWFQIDNTAIEKIFADMIDDINLRGIVVRDAIKSAENKVNVLMSGSRLQ